MIGIVGFGRFGKLMADYLSEDYDVYGYDIIDKTVEINASGAIAAPLKEVCRQDIVILPVPISEFRRTLKTIKPLLKENAVIVDVCSVKEYPVQWMRELLPENVSILATHPMFGPDSAADSLHGRKIALCNEGVDERRYEKIKSYLSSRGLIVIETTPQDHDQQIAVSLALTHFIGRSLSEFGANDLNMDTEGYKRLLHILEVVEHDTWQLFVDMHRYNPYAEEMRTRFMDAMHSIENRIHAPIELDS
jgi:prephenate dehydrogenase